MRVQIDIPGNLRSYTGGASTVHGRGATLGDILDDLEARHAGLRAQLVVDGALHRLVNVYIDGQDARRFGGLSAPVVGAGRITIWSAVAGGAFGFAALGALVSARRGPLPSGGTPWNRSSC
jgi:molybdopterin converting factor small subunit